MGASVSLSGPQLYLQLLVVAAVIGGLVWVLRRR